MEIKDLEIKTRKDFNNAIALMGIIPLLAFVYMLAGQNSSLDTLAGQTGYIILLIMTIVLLGIFLGRQALWSLIKQLFDHSRRILEMQKELIEKGRLAAITETVLTVGHEINNPLLIMQGNLELLECELKTNSLDDNAKSRVNVIRNNCERIMQVTGKLSSLESPVLTQIYGKSKMIDLDKSA